MYKDIEKDVLMLNRFALYTHFIFISQAFGDAYQLVIGEDRSTEELFPYVVHNDSGLVTTLKLDKQLQVI